MTNRTLTVRLSEEEHEALRAYAFALDDSMNDVVRRAIQSYLAEGDRVEEVDSLLAEARTRYRTALDKLADL